VHAFAAIYGSGRARIFLGSPPHARLDAIAVSHRNGTKGGAIMKTSRIALALGALASLAAGAAAAQTPMTFSYNGANVTLYGNIDYYLNYQKSSSGSRVISLQDGAYLRTRLGLKGDKDVGNGYTMKFTAEQGLNDQTGAQADTTRLFDRQFWAGIDTPVGEFRAGRQNTAIFFRGSQIDNTTRTLGSVINAFGVPSRFDSDLAYISHRLAGWLFEAHYSLQGSAPNQTTNQAVYQLALEWAGGPFVVGYGGIAGKPPAGAPVSNTVRYDNVYANYNYGAGRIYAAYVRSNNNSTTPGSPSGTLNNGGSPLGNTGTLVTGTDTGALTFYNIYQLSADYQITPKLRLGGLVGQIKAETGTDKDADGWSAAAYYDVFRDTMLYAIVDQLKNEANAGFRPSGSAGLTKTFTAPNDVNGRTISGVHLGFVYKF
jgi:predicted porin